MNLLKFTLLSFFLLITSLAWAQPEEVDEIPTSATECYKYMEEIMLATKREECEEIMATMKQKQKAGKWTPEFYDGLADLGNEMIKRNMKRYNFFRHLLDIIHTFSDDEGLASQHFSKWIKISKKILMAQQDGKTVLFENYLKFSRNFWKTGNLYDISKGSHKWRSESRVFDMKYEDGILSIKYENTNLICYNKRDSLTIKDAKGIYYPLEQKWKGVKGQVDWTAEGAKDAYALLKTYTIETRSTSYSASNATLHYNSVFKQPIEGRLKDRAVKRNAKNMRYPRFESNSRNIRMDDIGEGVTYMGGFVMTGSSVQGYGDEKGLSTVYITNSKGQRIVKAESGNFDILKGEKVVSQDAKVTLYINHDDGSIDSIYHPSINFLYSIVQRKLDLARSDSRISRVPFSNSLQEMDMKVTSISWLIDTDELTLGDNNQDLEMASENHFDQLLFEKYQNIISINPLIKFAVYSDKLKQAQELAGSVRPDTNPWEQEGPMSDEEYCKQQPDFCDENGKPFFDRGYEDEPIDTAFLKEIGEWPPTEVEETPEDESEDDFADTDPRVVSADELAALLDKRMERITILTSEEIEKASKNPSFKIIERNQDYRDFMKGFPKTYKFGAIDVYNLMTVVPDPSFNLSNTLPLFLEMVKDGFVVYNKEKGTIRLRDKLFHYAASVNTKKKDHDFDKIRIKSVPSRNNKKPANAVFNMKKGEIETFGVQEFVLSDSQQVIARPFNGQVKMLKGRNMDFNGVMSGGFCNFTGTNFHFIYDIFHVEMDSINFMDLFIYKRARHGEEAGILAGRPKEERAIEDLTQLPTNEKEPINSVIEGGSGLMLIDVPSNKSGRMQSDPIYPSFESTSKSRVYYDRRNRQGEGVYDRETFYYEVEPFMLDGMDRLKPEQLVFEGKLYAADIFEPINEQLRVMYHDLSLGFETETRGNDPNPIYLREDKKGKGSFKGAIGISNEGLIGNGRLDYLGATVESEYIEFLPDQFRAEDVDSFNLEGSVRDGVEFPHVKGEQVHIDWAPYSDSMYIESAIVEGVPFQFFDSTDFNLEGSLTLTPDGLLGRGTFDWYGATLESNPGGDFKFGKQSIASPSTAVIIKSQGVQKFAFENENVDAIIDFEKQTGDFISQESDLATDLPYNSYQTSLDQFHWNMKTDHIFMDAQEGKTGFFLATEQAQDSLVFLGEKADYDLNTGLLKIDGVEHIRIADAFVYPKDKHVEIEEASHMRTLLDSRIVADTLNQNHVIQRASINVLSRSEFKASGYLEFNIENYKEQEIKFDNVTSAQESPGQFVTVGSGTVRDTANFHLDKRTKFKGEVLLNSKSELLTFKGYAKISSAVIPTQEWFGIESKVDKRDVSIEYETPKNPAGEFMYVGLFLDLDTMDLYPAILSPKRNPTDRSIFSAVGVLKFDNEENMYLFGDSARVLGDAEAGKLFTVSEKNAKVVASGRFDFDKGFISATAPDFGVDVVGDFTFFLNTKSDYLFETSANLDFYLPQSLRDVIVNDIQSNDELIDKVLYASIKNEKLHQHMKNYITDDKKFDRMWKKVEDDERLQLPNDFSHTFFFINNKLLWSSKTQSFITKGRRLQLASIGGKHVGQVLKGHLEIMNDPARGDALTFYIISPNGDWYYFSYQNGFLKTVSSNPDYNNAISSLKNKDRRVRTANGNWIELMIGSPGEYSSFKNKASAAHN
ncbi:hypothetical protein [Aureispira anguillae]|uniref:Uncharacterized protein n=1 Tax=Aureispira anguillae TaxID=2864201 RepID=A0A915YDE5_9BACT|nr:hypothetical protein [Aureispira anguillae]BDS11045.1 hypothetical protein AsAng_0017560 [Aureispira anguillae]